MPQAEKCHECEQYFWHSSAFQFVAFGPYGRLGSSITGLLRIPTLSTSISTMSPAFRYRGGCMPMPTPSGVPVRITVPAYNVVLPLKKETRVATLKIMSAVEEFW